jgi:hypothetical protein
VKDADLASVTPGSGQATPPVDRPAKDVPGAGREDTKAADADRSGKPPEAEQPPSKPVANDGDAGMPGDVPVALPRGAETVSIHAPDLWAGGETVPAKVVDLSAPKDTSPPPVVHVAGPVGADVPRDVSPVLPADVKQPGGGAVEPTAPGPGEKDGTAAAHDGGAPPGAMSGKGSAPVPAATVAPSDPPAPPAGASKGAVAERPAPIETATIGEASDDAVLLRLPDAGWSLAKVQTDGLLVMASGLSTETAALLQSGATPAGPIPLSSPTLLSSVPDVPLYAVTSDLPLL